MNGKRFLNSEKSEAREKKNKKFCEIGAVQGKNAKQLCKIRGVKRNSK